MVFYYSLQRWRHKRAFFKGYCDHTDCVSLYSYCFVPGFAHLLLLRQVTSLLLCSIPDASSTVSSSSNLRPSALPLLPSTYRYPSIHPSIHPSLPPPDTLKPHSRTIFLSSHCIFLLTCLFIAPDLLWITNDVHNDFNLKTKQVEFHIWSKQER